MADRPRTLAALLTTRWRRFGTREALQRYQQRRLARVLARARRAFPYYAHVPAADLSAFPVLDQDAWLAGFDGLNDRRISLADCLSVARDAEQRRSFDAGLGGLSIGLSAGTSGRQRVLLTAPAERARRTGVLLAKALPSLSGDIRVALVLRSGEPLYEAVAGGRFQFRWFDLALEPDVLAARLAAFQPTVLAAPPQVLAELASRGLDNPPPTVYSMADGLDADVAGRIEVGFGAPALQIYQATEGFLGISCGEGRLHLNEDLMHVEREVLDPASGRFAAVITDLYPTSQAIIRYRLDDVLLPGPEDCPCGSVYATVSRIEGRADDVLRFATVAGGEQPVFADFVRAAMLGAPVVEDFRLVQRADRSLRLAVRPQRAQASAHLALQALLRSRELVVPEITGMPWPVEERTAKLRRVRRIG